jgi:hypothetical protein
MTQAHLDEKARFIPIPGGRGIPSKVLLQTPETVSRIDLGNDPTHACRCESEKSSAGDKIFAGRARMNHSTEVGLLGVRHDRAFPALLVDGHEDDLGLGDLDALVRLAAPPLP